jgi:Cdc6-like AAA superfamily ATPase
MKHRVEYYDKALGCNGVWYVNCTSYREAITLFRQIFSKEGYDIIEVCKVYDRDWSKY